MQIHRYYDPILMGSYSAVPKKDQVRFSTSLTSGQPEVACLEENVIYHAIID